MMTGAGDERISPTTADMGLLILQTAQKASPKVIFDSEIQSYVVSPALTFDQPLRQLAAMQACMVLMRRDDEIQPPLPVKRV